jgi:hypothetical protein
MSLVEARRLKLRESLKKKVLTRFAFMQEHSGKASPAKPIGAGSARLKRRFTFR